MRLDKFKELFEKVLCKDDFSELEKAIGFGLELEKNSVSQLPDAGSENLGKLVEELPGFFKKFKKAGNLRARAFRHKIKDGFWGYFPGVPYDNTTGLLSGLFVLSSLGSFVPMGVGFFGLAVYNKTPLFLPFLATFWVGGGLLANDAVQAILASKERVDHYYHPLAFPVAAVRHARGRGAKRKALRVRDGLADGLSRVYHGGVDYSKKWFKRETLVLKKMLSRVDAGFAARFLQVEKRLFPFDKLKLYRGVEECLRGEADSYLRSERGFDGAGRLSGMFGLAKSAGVQVSELREGLLRDLGGERERLDELMRVFRRG